MNDLINVQLVSVVVGGLLATVGSIATTTLLERFRQRRESRNLALAFKGELTALVTLIEEREYVERFAQVIDQIESTREPFYVPFRIRFKYDRVYDANVDRIGLLKPPLPEQLPLFYTRMTSIMEDLISLGDGTYTQIDIDQLLRIYRFAHDMLASSVTHGREIIAAIRTAYALGPADAR